MFEKTVSILGCGWLGFPLAKALIDKGYIVRGSTTSAEKLETFQNAKVEPYLIDLRERDSHISTDEFLNSKYLVIAIPPGVKHNNDFLGQLSGLIPYVEKSKVKHSIFISSTSVYPNVNKEVDEQFESVPDSKSGNTLLAAERLLLSNDSFDSTILRMAGLYGYDRKPGKFLAGKRKLVNAQGKVNLIHQDDCVEIIIKVIEKNVWGEVFNCCSDSHPSRQEFYTKAATILGLPAPEFEENANSSFKIVSNDKVKKALDYSFIHPDPMALV